MLVVTANWAFPDGTLLAASDRRRVARAWLRQVRTATIRAGFGRDGVYRPPSALDIVLAGDTLDCLVSAAWTGRERPWHAGSRAHALRRSVVIRCVRRAAPLLAGIATLVRRGLGAPTADQRGRPSTVATTRVPVRVALLAGDRDRPVTEMAAEITARGAAVAEAWCDGAVFVTHGHEFDPVCHFEQPCAGDRPPTIGESVAVGLVARFAAGLRGGAVPPRTVAPLVGALAAASVADIPGVVAAWSTAAACGDGVDGRDAVATAWRRAVDDWVREAERVPPDSGLAASPVDALAAWFVTDGAGQPPPALAGLLDRGAAVATASNAGAETVVLGHPVRPTDTPSLVCLGRSVVRPWRPTMVVRADGAADAACVAAGQAPIHPATVTVQRSGGRTVWGWITGADGPGEAVTPGAAVIVEAA